MTNEEILINIYGKGADLSDKSRQSNLTIGMVIYVMEQAKNLQQSDVIKSVCEHTGGNRTYVDGKVMCFDCGAELNEQTVL